MIRSQFTRLNSARVSLYVFYFLIFNSFQMSLPFSINIHMDRPYHRFIKKNGFISCVVCIQTPHFRSLRMGFCLHCKELLSYSGALKHSKNLRDEQHVDLSRLFRPEKCDLYKQQIMEDAWSKYEKWTSQESRHSNPVMLVDKGGDCPEVAMGLVTGLKLIQLTT